MRNIIFLLLLLIPSNTALAIKQTVISRQIKTLQVMTNNDWLSPPVMRLGSDDVLNVSFDELSHTYKRFIYHIDHCEADWTRSEELFESDFLTGFNDNPIEDYENSLNTTVLYTHYSFRLPNDNCSLKMSGNYRITVIDDETGDSVAMIRFMVVEPIMNIRLECTTNTDLDINKRHQQINMWLNYGNVRITNPERQLTTVITQNNSEYDMRMNVRPNIINTKGLEWKHNRSLIFEGGNEYHKFEVLDVTHPTMGIDRISWDGNYFNVYPFMDKERKNYLYDHDANGSFYIRNSDNIDNNNTCDYVFVHYKLQSAFLNGGQLMVDGQWTTDNDKNSYIMEYDDSDGTYNLTLMQKQGYYSYRYLLRGHDGSTMIPPTEGCFYQTENRYQAYVYLKGTGERTWRLVGYREISNTEH